MQKSFITTMINQRIGKPVKVFEADGSVLVLLEPGMSYDAKSVNPETLYARWSEVRWKADGTVHLLARTDFQEPERGRWVLRMLNQDGQPAEWRQVGDQRICLPKSIPVVVSVPLTDQLVKFKELTIKAARVMVKANEPGYLAHRWVVQDVKTPRPDSELRALAKILDDLGKK